MKPLVYCLFLLLIIVINEQLRAQQFMLPPAPQQLVQPQEFDLFGGGVTPERREKLWLLYAGRKPVHLEGRLLRAYYDDTTQNQHAHYNYVTRTAGGRIWLIQNSPASDKRLVYIDSMRQQVTSLPDTAPVVRSFLGKYSINQLLLDRRGNFWISVLDHGLLRVNPQTLAFEHVVPQHITVRCLTEGPDGRIWFSTATKLNVIDPRTKQRQTYGRDDQQPSDDDEEITALRVRDNGDVLISRFNRIDILTPTTGKVRNILLPLPTPTSRMWTQSFVPDQLGNDYFSVGVMVCRITRLGLLERIDFPRPAEKVISIYISQQSPSSPGRLLVSTMQQLYAYDLSRLRPIDSFNILDVLINGTRLIENEHTIEDRYQRDSTGQPRITMQEGDFVQFRFTAFAELKKSYFRYKLDGYDKDWAIYFDKIGIATYQPPPGQYYFLFNKNGPGGWESTPARLLIEVKPIFWKTIWFRTFVFVSLAGLLFWLVRAQNRRQKLRQELARREGEAASLRQLDEFKSQFFANVTHEFRTPLTIILNATEQLTDASLSQRHQERLNAIQRNANQLLRLINETLDMAKLDAGKLDHYAHLGDPLAFLGLIVSQFTGLAEQKNIDLQWKAEPPPDSEGGQLYYFDDTKFEKIVYNLLANALKFTPGGGHVRVDCQITDTHRFVLRVADTGIGIPADQLPRIFERFHQVDASTTRAYSGTGIGLALVRELTEWLGGSVTVKSTLGQGSVFTVELPLNRDIPYPPGTEQHPLSPASHQVLNRHSVGARAVELRPLMVGNGSNEKAEDTNQPLVLIVEDNAEMRAHVVDYLSAYYRVLVAENGRQGIDQALREVPDLIISDVMMPELDGYELVERLKSDERTSHIPLILLTAKSSYDSRLKGLGAGADDYVGKPFSLAELNLRIANCLRTRQNWQQRLNHRMSSSETVLVEPSEALLEKEARFVDRLRQLIIDHVEKETVDVDWLANQAGMSRTQLHRKLTALTTLSTNRFIHRVRLEKAAELLQTGEFNVAQAAFRVGYSSPSHFTKVFQEHFGYPPAKLKV
ncbi:ATP-binding protein [Spirosoma soli]|uniref:histidine kinase n=1 Tax=Spirosoma soli TaxID=1770529 RepID=A0ABW5MA03_9BACT